MIFDAIKRLFLPSPGSSAEDAAAMRRGETRETSGLRVSERPHKIEGEVAGSNPAPGAISRRSFFSFCTAATIIAAKPGLFLGAAERRLITPKLWQPIGKVTRTYIVNNVLYADILLHRPDPMFGDGSIFTARSIEHSGPGEEIFVGPGGQITSHPPQEDLWTSCQKARGLRPDEVVKFGPGRQAEDDALVKRWAMGQPMPRSEA